MFAIEATASAIAYCTAALLLGSLTAAGFLLPRGDPIDLRHQLLSVTVKLLPVFVIASIVSLVVQGTHLNGGAFPNLKILSRYLLDTQVGKIWAVRQIYAIFLLGGLVWFTRRRGHVTGVRIFFFLSLPLVASRSFTSHAIAARENTVLAVSADALHLMATAIWAGGLPVLFWVLFRGIRRLNLSPSWAAEAVSRFSRLALVAVTLLVLTGIYQSWIQVRRLDILFETPYGQLLTLKITFFLCMAAVGALNLFSTRPSLLQARGTENLPDWLQIRTLIRIGTETVLGIGVFCLTAFLTLLPPGIHSLHQDDTHGTNSPQAYPERLNVLTWLGYRLAPAPILEPAEGAKVKIDSPKEGEVFHSDEVPIRYRFVKGKRGNHLHAYVDGRLMGMFSAPNRGTLTGIEPGRHALELRVTAEDHITELDAKDKVDFVVK